MQTGEPELRDNESQPKRSQLILKLLVDRGVDISDLDDLVNSRVEYSHAIPFLLEWIPEVEGKLKETLVRAVTVKSARGLAFEPLMIEMRGALDQGASGLMWAIGNAVSVVATKNDLCAVLEIVQDTRFGTARQMPILALGRIGSSANEDLLLGLLEDDEVAGHAIDSLGKIGTEKSLPYLLKFVNHKMTWIRNEAKRSIAKIEKRMAK